MKQSRLLGLEMTRGIVTLIALSAVGLGLIAYRFFFGLGAVTNLSDGYPWGFWIGIDILVGIALAAGGFVMAGLVHILGAHRYHSLTRPAILTALLGYLLFIFALFVDLGRPWHIWVTFISWNHVSPMFEVAWCVMFYTFVLTLEFAPAVLERFQLRRILRVWTALVPWVIVTVLTLFVYAMTESVAWAGATSVILLSWELLMRTSVMPRDKQMPLLLIMAGVMLSTLHQSSLGTLFLITDKLSDVWYSPLLPLFFFLSALMVAPAVVIIEALVSGKALGHKTDMSLLESLGRAMPYLIGLYVVVRLGDVLLRGVTSNVIALSPEMVWWWLELALLLLAMAHFATLEAKPRPERLLVPALATASALIIHRTGVSLIGINVPEYAAYIPALSEVLITTGIFAMGLLAFRLAVEYLPVYEQAQAERAVSEEPARYAARPAA